jgi:hypothetical protein
MDKDPYEGLDEVARRSSQTNNEQPSESEPDDAESDEVPEIIEEVIDVCNGVYIPDGVMATAASEPYTRMLNGQCIACGHALGANTVAFLTRHGVTMLFCGGACTSDYSVLGWLQEKHEDIMDALKFRGGHTDG